MCKQGINHYNIDSIDHKMVKTYTVYQVTVKDAAGPLTRLCM